MSCGHIDSSEITYLPVRNLSIAPAIRQVKINFKIVISGRKSKLTVPTYIKIENFILNRM